MTTYRTRPPSICHSCCAYGVVRSVPRDSCRVAFRDHHSDSHNWWSSGIQRICRKSIAIGSVRYGLNCSNVRRRRICAVLIARLCMTSYHTRPPSICHSCCAYGVDRSVPRDSCRVAFRDLHSDSHNWWSSGIQ